MEAPLIIYLLPFGLAAILRAQMIRGTSVIPR
jgi:hypothetical protein